MRTAVARAVLAALIVSAVACSKNDTSTLPLPPGGTGGGFDGGAGERPVTGNITPSGTVLIAIDAPLADAIQTTNAPIDVSARISVQNGTDVIDPSTVVVAVVPRGTSTTLSMGKLVGPAGQNTYTGKVSVAGLTAGLYTLVVSATSTTGNTGSDHVDIAIDSGPTIVVVSPKPGGHYKNGLNVQVIADAGTFGPLHDLKATVANMELTFQNDPPNSNQYKAVVDFNAPMPPLSGDQLFDVSAYNSDGTPGTRTELKLVFVVDNEGPTMPVTLPPPGAVVGGVIDISAAIEDDAGLNESSLQVLIGDKLDPQFKLPLTARGNGTYGVLFDTRNLTVCKPPPDTGLCIIYPTLSFRAADQLGNERIIAYNIAVDNVPPVADLVPPLIRDSKVDGELVCSHLFDPLKLDTELPDSLGRPGFSGDRPQDLSMVPQVFDLRARIEDDGNRATGLKNPPISTVDPAATAVYVLEDSSQPLVVDSDGDGYCDHINPHLIPTTNPVTSSREVLKVRLSPVPIIGSADFTPDPDPNFPLAYCGRGVDNARPLIPCLSEQPTIAIGYAGGLPAIWSVDPIEPLHLCFGGQFDTRANNITDAGWKCIAVATADMNGNASVSAPIRVWVNYRYPEPQLPHLDPPPTAPLAPSCTGTYDMATDTVGPGACRTRNFQPRPGRPEICYLKNCPICFGDDPSCPP